MRTRPTALRRGMRLRAVAAAACLAWALAAQAQQLGGGRAGQQGQSRSSGRALLQEAEKELTLSSDDLYFAICTVTKDRPEELREWADYHLALGAGRLYVFDTDNPEPNRAALEDLIQEGRVEYYALPHVTPVTVPQLQVRIYGLCLKHAAARHRWLGFWDVDEFMVVRDVAGIPSLPAFLRGLEGQAGLAVNWQLLGSGGHMSRPAGGVLASFQACTPRQYQENALVKSIVNTEFAESPSTDPHHFLYRGGRTPVSPGGAPVEGPSTPGAIDSDRLALFHYATKSAEDFRRKRKRGSAMGNYKGMDFFQRIDAASTESCPEAYDACRRWGLRFCA